MKRVCIIGCGGAGKSTFARELGAATGLPVVHLDAHYWRAGWTPTPRDEFARLHEDLVAREEWIIDGNFGFVLEGRLARADTVVYLDYPTLTCLWGALRRVTSQYGQVRSDMAEGCPEGVDWEFVQWILRFRRDQRPENLSLLDRHPRLTVHRPRNRRELRALASRIVPSTG